MDTILNWDISLFYLLNSQLTHPFLDILMSFVSRKANFLGLLLLVWLVIFILGGGKGRRVAIVVLLVVLIGDLISGLLKDIFQRIRPCDALTGVRLLVGCGDSYSFPSNHAMNVFGGAIYLSYAYPRYLALFIFVAGLVSYSRVYLGVHYPLDVIGGGVFGVLWAGLVIWGEGRVIKRK